jgi:membrane associated rhomboid family serine protease
MAVIPPFVLGPIFELPAVIFLGWWFLLQFFNGTLSLLAHPSRVAGIAWWAHIGGFAFGVFLCRFIVRKRTWPPPETGPL